MLFQLCVMTYETFEYRLESILGERAEPAEITQGKAFAGSSEAPLGVLLLAIENNAKRRGTSNEDFILGPLPNNMTLYEPMNLIEVAKVFYGQRGLKLANHSKSCNGYEEILFFDGEEQCGMVQFDLGTGYRTDDQYELWVTAMFSPTKNSESRRG